MKSRIVLFLAAIAAAVAATGLLALRPPPTPSALSAAPAPRAAPLAETFERLDAAAWSIVSRGDFQERLVDIRDGRLRLRCATIGTDDRTVKTLGVRGASRVELRPGCRLAADLDWNGQANGSYLSAALVLAPAAVDGNPLDTPSWIKVEYHGVPPGKNGRLVVGRRRQGRDLPLFTEGWPELHRGGRPIGLQRLELRFRADGFEVRENDVIVFDSKEALGFDAAHVYLLMSSHSNYPPRELFFDNVRVSGAD
jgi:hypothetical protein